MRISDWSSDVCSSDLIGDLLAGQRIELGDLLDLVAEEADAPRHILIVRGEDFEAVAAHAEIAARERLVVALVLQCDELADDLAIVGDLAFLEIEDHRGVSPDRSEERRGGKECVRTWRFGWVR